MARQNKLKEGMKIGTAIRTLRKERGWTLDELADRANTSKSNLSNVESDRQGYSPVLLASLADAFGFGQRVSQLFGKAEQLAGLDVDQPVAMPPDPPDDRSPETEELLRIWQQLGTAERDAVLLIFRCMDKSALTNQEPGTGMQKPGNEP